MSIESLKQQARKHEQNEAWDKALDQYNKALAELAREEQVDIGLYNRVGDLYVRVGKLDAAVEHYDKAVDLYREAYLPNNAIAVCKKIIRNVPERHTAYLRIGQIRAEQGFLPDARTHFLTYAERMQQAGDLDESFRALIEFCDLAPEDVGVRITVADQMAAKGRNEEAIAQLLVAHRHYTQQGETAEAEGLETKILAIDPEADLNALPAMDALAGSTVGDDGEIIADFGEIGIGADAFGATTEAEVDIGGAMEEAAADSGDAVEIDAGLVGFEISTGDEGEGDDEDVAVELPTMSFDDDDEGEAVELPTIDFDDDDEGEAVELPTMSFDDDDEGEAIELPTMDFGDELDSGGDSATVEETAAPVDFALEISEPEEASAEVVSELPPVAAAGEALESAFEDSVAEVEAPAVEESVLSASVVEEAAQVPPAAFADPVAEAAPEPVPEAPEPAPPPADDPSPAAGGGDGGYVDLGAMILGGGEEKSTRFTVAYEEPSGDEEADFAKMLSQFKEKVSENLDSSDVRAHYDLGTAYKEMGLLDEAISSFQAALRASADHLPTYEVMGQTFMEMGQPEAAVKSLERALEAAGAIEDDLVGIYYYLGRAYEELDNKPSAVEFYDRVFSLDINFADVTERLRELR